MIVTQSIQAAIGAVLAALVLTGSIHVHHVYTLALVLGFAATLDVPARQAIVSDLVDDDRAVSAVAVNSASYNAARIIGPGLAGVLIATIGTGWALAINTASYAAMIAALATVRLPGGGHLASRFCSRWRATSSVCPASPHTCHDARATWGGLPVLSRRAMRGRVDRLNVDWTTRNGYDPGFLAMGDNTPVPGLSKSAATSGVQRARTHVRPVTKRCRRRHLIGLWGNWASVRGAVETARHSDVRRATNP